MLTALAWPCGGEVGEDGRRREEAGAAGDAFENCVRSRPPKSHLRRGEHVPHAAVLAELLGHKQDARDVAAPRLDRHVLNRRHAGRQRKRDGPASFGLGVGGGGRRDAGGERVRRRQLAAREQGLGQAQGAGAEGQGQSSRQCARAGGGAPGRLDGRILTLGRRVGQRLVGQAQADLRRWGGGGGEERGGTQLACGSAGGRFGRPFMHLADSQASQLS